MGFKERIFGGRGGQRDRTSPPEALWTLMKGYVDEGVESISPRQARLETGAYKAPVFLVETKLVGWWGKEKVESYVLAHERKFFPPKEAQEVFRVAKRKEKQECFLFVAGDLEAITDQFSKIALIDRAHWYPSHPKARLGLWFPKSKDLIIMRSTDASSKETIMTSDGPFIIEGGINFTPASYTMRLPKTRPGKRAANGETAVVKVTHQGEIPSLFNVDTKAEEGIQLPLKVVVNWGRHKVEFIGEAEGIDFRVQANLNDERLGLYLPSPFTTRNDLLIRELAAGRMKDLYLEWSNRLGYILTQEAAKILAAGRLMFGEKTEFHIAFDPENLTTALCQRLQSQQDPLVEVYNLSVWAPDQPDLTEETIAYTYQQLRELVGPEVAIAKELDAIKAFLDEEKIVDGSARIEAYQAYLAGRGGRTVLPYQLPSDKG